MIWFTSDQHFGHKKIIEYSMRPFSDVNEMDYTLIDNWNRVVNPKDDVYILGDVTMTSRIDEVYEIFNSLIAKNIYVIPGNHDNWAKKWKKITIETNVKVLDKIEVLRYNGERITLCHYPLREWYKSHINGLHFYGHVHGNISAIPRSIEVGVDVWDYFPVDIDTLLTSVERFREHEIDSDILWETKFNSLLESMERFRDHEN